MSAEQAKRLEDAVPSEKDGSSKAPGSSSDSISHKGVSDEYAVQTLAAWCKRQGFEMSFVTRQIGSRPRRLCSAEAENDDLGFWVKCHLRLNVTSCRAARVRSG
jgi:hypothetical protein